MVCNSSCCLVVLAFALGAGGARISQKQVLSENAVPGWNLVSRLWGGDAAPEGAVAAAKAGCLAVAENKWGEKKCRQKMQLKDVAKALGQEGAKSFPKGFSCQRGYVCGSGEPRPGNSPSVCGRSAGALKTCMPVVVGGFEESASEPEPPSSAAQPSAEPAVDLAAEPEEEDDVEAYPYDEHELDEADAALQEVEPEEEEEDEVAPEEAALKSAADAACASIMSIKKGSKCRGTMSLKDTKKLLGSSKAAPLGDRFTCTRAYVCGGRQVVTGESPSVCGHTAAVRTCTAYDLNPPAAGWFGSWKLWGGA